MDPIKEAFLKAKQDIDSLRHQIEVLTQEIYELKRTLALQGVAGGERNPPEVLSTDQQTNTSENSSFQHINPTHSDTPTHNLPLYSLKTPFSHSSTGNRGVPTDRQTDQ